LPAVAGLSLPFSPIQIIILELFMDLAASAGFVAEPAEKTYTTDLLATQKKILSIQALSRISF